MYMYMCVYIYIYIERGRERERERELRHLQELKPGWRRRRRGRRAIDPGRAAGGPAQRV